MAKDNRPGIILYLEDLDAMEELSDEELGQLVRLLKLYEETGQQQKLKGYVGMAYSFIIPKMERDRERYEKSCKQRSEAAKKRWAKEAAVCESDATACEKNATAFEADTTAYDLVQEEKEEEKEKENVNENEHEEEQEVSCTGQVTGGGDGGMTRQFLNLMSRYCDLTGERYQLVRENFASLCKQYSEAWLSKAVECAVKSGNTSIAYIRGILRNWAQAGRPDEREFREKPQYHDNPALNYSQRTNDLENLYMDL